MTIIGATKNFFLDVLDEHAPIKQKRPRKQPLPYMNSRYRKLIYKTRQAHNKFIKHRTKENWENNRYLRNLKTKVKRESIQILMKDVVKDQNPKTFWPTIKPF